MCQVGLRPTNEKLQYSQGSVQLGRTKSAITLLLLFFSSSNSVSCPGCHLGIKMIIALFCVVFIFKGNSLKKKKKKVHF